MSPAARRARGNASVAALLAPLLAASVVPSAHVQAQEPPRPSRADAVMVVCVRDAATAAPVVEARVDAEGRRARTASDGCVAVAAARRPRDGGASALRITRLGYAPRTVRDRAGDGDTLHVLLVPVAAAISGVTVTAPRDAAAAGRLAVSLSTGEARERGARDMASLLPLLPFVQPRGARSDLGVAVRGARREQVVVTYDGMPINDPASGLAELADLPLVAVGSATVQGGADPLGAGPGAVGGVLALGSARGTVLHARAESFGGRAVEAAWSEAIGAGTLRIAGGFSRAENDFPFRNTVTPAPEPPRETRVNNDVTRGSIVADWTGERTQALLLASAAGFGLVGPVNVRAYDADRAETRRLLARVRRAVGAGDGVIVDAGVRAFTLAYRDPARPVLDADARALAVDVVARGGLAVGDGPPVAWQVGAGGDGVRTSADLAADRGRAWAALSQARPLGPLDVTAGVRLDAIGGAGPVPSASLALEHAGVTHRLGARVSQAVRAPTLYDLYFASPQRLQVRVLDPERVALDAELLAAWTPPALRAVALHVEGALVARTVRDAIVWFPGNFSWAPQNAGTERLRGVELRTRLATGAVTVQGWVTHYDATLTSGALRIPTPYVARRAAGLVTGVSLLGADATVSLRHQGRRPYTAGPRDPAFELPAVTLLDLALSRAWDVGDGAVRATLAADNAADLAWQSVRGFPAPGRRWSLAVTITPDAASR